MSRGHIDKGIDQLTKAMKRVKNGAQLSSSKDGTPITLRIEATLLWHGVIVVSDMGPGPDWRGIAEQLIQEGKNKGAMLQVLDLQELAVLIGASKTPVAFMARLTLRQKAMVDSGNAFIRSRAPQPLSRIPQLAAEEAKGA